MVYLHQGSNPTDWGTFIPYPPNCKCGSSRTVCLDFWDNKWQCNDCNFRWTFKRLALPPYYDPNFPYPEMTQAP